MADTAARSRLRLRIVAASTINFGYAAAMPLIALSHKTPSVGIQDWMLHAFAFGLQVGLLSLVTGPLLSPLAALVGAAAGGLLCGTLVEFLQVLVFGCAFETVDLLADAVGVGLATALLALAALSRSQPPRDDSQ